MNELLAISTDAAWPPGIVRVLAWTLLHFFWQGALVAAALAGALALLRHRSAGLRYGVAIVALAVMAAMPALTGWWLGSLEPGPSGDDAMAATVQTPATSVIAATPQARGTTPAPSPRASRSAGGHWLDPTLPWLVGLWLAGIGTLSLVHLGGWLRVRRLRTRSVRPAAPRWRHACRSLARRLGIRRPVELLESTRITVPVVVGWLKPVVLFPASTFTGLAPRQLESILAHELAHVRRHDYLVNVLQVAVETLLFYHPAVWWCSRQVRDLREHCCDDLAVAVCGDRMVYARALADLEELRFATPVFALGAGGGSLLERIRRLAGKGAVAEAPGRAPGWVAGTLAAVALTASAVALAFAGRPGLAQEPVAAAAVPEIGIRSVPLVPPVILAQVTEESGSTSSRRPADETAASATGEDGARPSTGETSASERTARTPGSLPIPIDDLIEMKMHGLDDLLDEVEGTAYATLPTRQLLEMARFGVDRELIAELDAAGYRDLRASELVELAKFGVDGELIAELEAAGLGTPPVAELVEMAKFGADGDYIQEMRGAGYEVTSVAELVELSKFGVDDELIAELAEYGYRGLTTDQLVEMAKFGVDGDYIRELRDAGVNNLSVEDLTRMARHGIDAEFLGKISERERI